MNAHGTPERKPLYTCCICHTDAVTDKNHTCQDCRDVFLVADGEEAAQTASSRVSVGPTDI